MNDIVFLAQFFVVVAAATAPIVVVIRRLSDSDSMFDVNGQTLGEPTWPRGVQEDEPHPWNFAGADSVGVTTDAAPAPKRAARPAPMPA